MKHENDKWLEEQLTTPPSIENADFVNRVMDEVGKSHSKAHSQRKLILFSTYVISISIFLVITPWDWLSMQLNASRMELLSTFSTNGEMQTSLMTISVIFIISFFGVVLGLEQK